MAPKGKKGKKAADDDWEAELGETIAPAGEPTENGDHATNDAAEDDNAGGGGLLAAIRKNKDKRKKKGKVDNDFVEGENPTEAEPVEAPDLSAKAPEEATFDDDDVFAGTANKKGKGAKKDAPKPAENSDDDAGGGLKSKKEKEKEKREREKARKKDQAAKKKTTAPAPPAETKAEPEKAVKAAPEQVDVPEKEEKGGKKKKVPAHLAAIQKQQEALAKQREEQARLDAEEKAVEEERSRKDAEEESKKAEARERKKLKEKEKKEQLKKEGKLLTDAEKKRQTQQQLRMQQLLDSGAQVAGFAESSDDKKKPVVDKKKRKGPVKQEVDLDAAAEKARQEAEAAAAERERVAKEKQAAAEAAAAAEPVNHKDDESDLEDWEAAADDDVKDSWDADSEEEASKATKSATNGTAKAPATNGQAKGDATTSLPVRPGKSVQESESESDSDSEDSSEDEELTARKQADAKRKAEALERKKKSHEAALAAQSTDNLRSPICCILGHVDTGKTKLLDKIRQTNVQEGEAGGITQQIGATYFPTEALTEKIAPVNKDGSFQFKVPGLLVIDTPGHESFSNLRSRGSSLCNIAILVVDIMHGLEPQTLESMKLLRSRKTPFIVALNKIDRLYGWNSVPNNGFRDSLAKQRGGVQSEFKDRLEKTKVAFAEEGFNAELYYENKNMGKYVSLVPTSAHTGEGIPDMLKLLVSLTQDRMTGKLMYLAEVEGTVLEVKKIEGLGTTIDVVLSNGVLREGDRIVISGMNGAITTTVRALLTPAPLKELRLKSQYVHNKEAKASLGVKIAANDLDNAVAGSRLLVVGEDDDTEDLEEEVMADLQQLLTKIDKQARGVSVHASTLGSLEALLDFLRSMKIPVGNIGLGTVFKTEVMRAGVMLEKKLKEYAVMLCFDVAVDKDAAKYAEDNGITIFTADIIYHLFDNFTAYAKKLEEERKEESKLDAVFPAVLNPLQVFNKKDPIVVGVDVVEGNLRVGTPIAAIKHNSVTGVKDIVTLGRV